MKTMKGFFLTEVLVFLFLFSFFSLVLMRFIATATTLLMNINKKSDEIATLASAFDWLMRDLHVFDTLSDTLTVEGEKMLKINSPAERITWKLHEGKLMRVLQRYDTALQRWKKTYSSCVADHIENISFEIVRNKKAKDKIEGIICTIFTQNSEKKVCQLQQAIALRNRVI